MVVPNFDKKREVAKKLMWHAVELAKEEGLDELDIQECFALALVAGFSALDLSIKDFTAFLRDLRNGYIKMQGKFDAANKSD